MLGAALPQGAAVAACVGLHAAAARVQESRLSYACYSALLCAARPHNTHASDGHVYIFITTLRHTPQQRVHNRPN